MSDFQKILTYPTIAVIGLGYVGLTLANAFAKKYKVIGYDIDENKIKRMNSDIDNERLPYMVTSNKEKLKLDSR